LVDRLHLGPLEARPRERVGERLGKLRLPCKLRGVREAYFVCEYIAVERDEKGICCRKEDNRRTGIC
jgi:hypothetical protein